MVKKVVLEGIATLMGTIIGAGILGIPYVISQSGYIAGFIMLVFLGICALGMNLALGEVVLRTKGNHQLTGYAEKYLGKNARKLMAFSMFIGLYGAMIAYLLGIGESLFAIFGFWSPLIFTLIFFSFVIIVIYVGLKLIEEVELMISVTILTFMVIIICVLLFSKGFSMTNIATYNASNLLIPYGVILFSYLGAVSIPEVKEEMIRHRKHLKKAIIIGSLVPIALYSLFSFAMVGVFGGSITKIATVGLGQAYGSNMYIITNLFAIFAMTGSLLAISLAMKEQYLFDYKIGKNMSWFLTCFVPILLILIGLRDFIKTIGFAGAIAGGIDGILIVLMLWASRTKGDRKPEYHLGEFKFFGLIIMTVFFLGIVYQILSQFGYFG